MNKEKVSTVIKVVFPLLIFFDISVLVIVVYCAVNGFDEEGWLLSLIGMGFFAWHITYRPIMGQIVGFFRPVLRLKLKRWKVSKREALFYEKYLHIKSWKDKVPAWNRNHFVLHLSDMKDINKVSQVLRYNISAEITHTANAILGILFAFVAFSPLVYKWLWAFLLASIIVSFIADVPFILIQRYNRARVMDIYLRLCEKENKQEKELDRADELELKLNKIEIKIKMLNNENNKKEDKS